jgi:hypothetical protein
MNCGDPCPVGYDTVPNWSMASMYQEARCRIIVNVQSRVNVHYSVAHRTTYRNVGGSGSIIMAIAEVAVRQDSPRWETWMWVVKRGTRVHAADIPPPYGNMSDVYGLVNTLIAQDLESKQNAPNHTHTRLLQQVGVLGVKSPARKVFPFLWSFKCFTDFCRREELLLRRRTTSLFKWSMVPERKYERSV